MRLYQISCALAVGAATAAVSLSTACSSASSGGNFLSTDGGGGNEGGGNTSGYGCVYTGTAGMECTLYSDLNASGQSMVQTMCTQANGTTVMTCPTNDLVGCCTYTTGGYKLTSCYFCGPPASLEGSCTSSMYNGTWSNGTGGPAACDGGA
jgi:hypothetical protein